MKNKFLFLIVLPVGVLIFGMMGNSMAATITYDEMYIPGQDYLMDVSAIGDHKSHSWNFDITDNEEWHQEQVFSNGTIILSIEDNKGSGDGDDKATFQFDGDTGLTNKNINAFSWSRSFTVNPNQFDDGIIRATLTATNGDFYFRNAKLTYEVSSIEDPSPAPEPSTMFLFGLGLLGLAGVSRRKK